MPVTSHFLGNLRNDGRIRVLLNIAGHGMRSQPSRRRAPAQTGTPRPGRPFTRAAMHKAEGRESGRSGLPPLGGLISWRGYGSCRLRRRVQPAAAITPAPSRTEEAPTSSSRIMSPTPVFGITGGGESGLSTAVILTPAL